MDQQEQLRHAEWIYAKPGIEMLEFEPNPDAAQQWSVTFDIVVDSWVTGSDEGILWFDDQFLYVAGKHTSFAIPGHRLKTGLICKSECFKPLERSYFALVTLDRPATGWGKNLAIQFDVKITAPFFPERFALIKAVKECRENSKPEIEGQLPPLTPFLNAHSRANLRKIFLHDLIIRASYTLPLLVGVSLLMERLRFNTTFALLIFGVILCQIFANAYPRMKLNYTALKSLEKYSRIGR